MNFPFMQRVTEGNNLNVGLNIVTGWARHKTIKWGTLIIPLFAWCSKYYDIQDDALYRGVRILCIRAKYQEKELSFRVGWKPVGKRKELPNLEEMDLKCV